MKNAVLLCIALFSCFLARAEWVWTDYRDIQSNYFHPIATGSEHRLLVMVFEQEFHSCGWNKAGNVNSQLVGEEQFDVLTAAFLAAWMGDKQISLLIDGCDSNRAKVIGMRIAK